MMRSSSSGLVVNDAAVASPIAQAHQASGCRSRGRAVDPITARQAPRRRRATTALPAIATTSSPITPQVRAAGTRAGLSACGSVASEDAVDAESMGDSASEPDGSAPALVAESLGDSPPPEPCADPAPEPLPDPLSDPLSPFVPAPSGPALRGESPGDSLASGDGEGVPDAEGDEDVDGLDVLDGLGDGELPPPLPLPFPPPFPPPLPPPPPVEPLVGPEVGEGVGLELDGSDVVGLAVGVAGLTGGGTAGGTPPPAGRSCCHAQPTEPPAGTIRPPTPEDENVQDDDVPSDHHRPQ